MITTALFYFYKKYADFVHIRLLHIKELVNFHVAILFCYVLKKKKSDYFCLLKKCNFVAYCLHTQSLYSNTKLKNLSVTLVFIYHTLYNNIHTYIHIVYYILTPISYFCRIETIPFITTVEVFTVFTYVVSSVFRCGTFSIIQSHTLFLS